MFFIELYVTLVSLKIRSRSSNLNLIIFLNHNNDVSVPVGQNMAICSEYRIEVGFFHGCMTLIMTLVSGDLKNRSRSLN